MKTLQFHLAALETSGLLRRAPSEPELEYLFRHALVQDAAYESLLKADRRVLHRTVGETLERLYAGQLEEIAPVLARHFAEAGDDERALKYFALAGDNAARVFANAEAVMHYTHALDIARRSSTLIAQQPDDTRPRAVAGWFLELCSPLGRVLEICGRYDEAIAHYNEMETLAQERGDRPLELAALMELTKLRAVPSAKYDPPQGRVLAERTLTLARALGDRAAEARVLWILLILNIYSGNDLLQAIPYGEQSEALARELNLRELLAFILNDIWYPYVGTGQLRRAWSALEEAGQLWRELGNIPMLAANLSYLSNLYLWEGELDQAVAYSEQGFQLAGSVGNEEGQATSRFLVGLAYTERGDFDQAIAVTETGIRLGEAFELFALLSGSRAELGWAYGQLGAVEHGLALTRRASAIAEEKIPPLVAWTRLHMARLHLLRGEVAAAEAALAGQARYRDVRRTFGFVPCYWIGLALAEGELALAQIDYARVLTITEEVQADLLRFGIRLFRADAHYLKARALLAQGRVDEAHGILTEACAEAEAIHSRRMGWQILAALSEIEAGRSNASEATRWRERARETAAYIAGHCPPELRQAFLNLPKVRKVMGNDERI